MVYKVALVVPEYRTTVGGHGGVAAVTDFIVSELSQEFVVDILSLRMSRKAAESRRILSPRTWVGYPRTCGRFNTAQPILDVGANWAELEAMRFRPRRVLDEQLAKYDAAVVISGSPAPAYALSRTTLPVVLQVATLARLERRRQLAELAGIRRLGRRTATKITDWHDRRGIRVPQIVLVENRLMERAGKSLGARQVRVCPPGVDTDIFSPPADPGIKAEPGYLIMVGRLADPRKDLPTLFRGYRGARELGVTQRLLVVGRGEPSDEDRRLLIELGLEPHVDIISNPSQPVLVTLLQGADMFVMSSAEEGLGIALIEGMASGLPVLSTATEGAKFVVGDAPVGGLVPIGDHASLGRSIAEWTFDGTRRASASVAARSRAVEKFSARRTGAEFREVVRDVIASHTAPS